MSFLKEIYNYIFLKSATLLNRKQLGSIDFSGLKEDLTQEEIREENAKIANVYSIIERKIRLAIQKEKDFIAEKSDGELQIAFGRGGINFADLLLKDFEEKKNAHLEEIKPKEQFNPNKIF